MCELLPCSSLIHVVVIVVTGEGWIITWLTRSAATTATTSAGTPDKFTAENKINYKILELNFVEMKFVWQISRPHANGASLDRFLMANWAINTNEVTGKQLKVGQS